jgi:putative membrane protein
MYLAKAVTVRYVLVKTWRIQLVILATVSVATIAKIEFLGGYLDTSVTVVTLLGSALSFFIGFLNAHAYGRWWEARGQWGRLIRSSRDFARLVLTAVRAADMEDGLEASEGQLQKKLIHRQLALINALRDRVTKSQNQDVAKYLDDDDRKQIEGMSNVPVALVLQHGRDLEDAVAARLVDRIQMLRFNEVLDETTRSIGGADQFAGTPFPPLYAVVVDLVTWFFLIVFPVTISDAVGYWAIPYGYAVGFLFVLALRVNRELMEPFGPSPAAVPVFQLNRSIEIDLLQQLGGEEIPPPTEPVGGLYVR